MFAADAASRDVLPALLVADEVDLRYNHFLGSVGFCIGQADFSIRWPIPLLDFAVAMRDIVRALEPGQIERFEFTESDEVIAIELLNISEFRLTATYAAGVATVHRDQLIAALQDFVERVFADILGAWPALGGNAAFQNLR